MLKPPIMRSACERRRSKITRIRKPNNHERLHWTEVGDETDEFDHTPYNSQFTLEDIDRMTTESN